MIYLSFPISPYDITNIKVDDGCDKLANGNEEFFANPKELKRQSLNESGLMLPCYKTT